MEFRLGDAEDLPVQDRSFDAVLSVFGVMLVPETMVGAGRGLGARGGAVGPASWTPDGFIGRMFGVITGHVPGPPSGGSASCFGAPNSTCPACWARRPPMPTRAAHQHLAIRLPGEFAAFFRRWYGPALKAFEVLDDNGRAALAARRTVRPAGSRRPARIQRPDIDRAHAVR